MDPQEIDFDFTRPYRFVDLEDNTTIVAEPNLIAEEYDNAIREFLVAVEGKCHDVHADYHLVTSDPGLRGGVARLPHQPPAEERKR